MNIQVEEMCRARYMIKDMDLPCILCTWYFPSTFMLGNWNQQPGNFLNPLFWRFL